MLVQKITPELLEWIKETARTGHKPDAVLRAMRDRGWNEEVARSAIEAANDISLAEMTASVPVPEPDTTHSPSVLRVSDREIQVLAEMRLPRVVVFGGLLSTAECDNLVELARERLERSSVMDGWSGGGVLSDYRTSDGMFFELGENEVVQRIEARIAELLRWPVERGEGMQVLRYRTGAEYRPHHDYLVPSVSGNDSELRRGGQRVATLLMYLSEVAGGGGTTFPDVGFQVMPIKGNALFFSYDRPHPMTRTLHAGAPVMQGEKWVATKWLRQSTFL